MRTGKDDIDNTGDLEALLREVGARDEPPAELVETVRAAVHAEWQTVVAQRRMEQRIRWSLAATVLLVVGASFFGWRQWSQMQVAVPVSFAAITRVDGVATRTRPDTEPTQSVQVGERIATGATLHTTAGAHVVLSLDSGLSMRLDDETTVAIVAPDRVALISGALYVDSPPQAQLVALNVDALGSSIRHIGTQYQVRTLAGSVEIGVREGRVEVTNDAGASTGQAGERMRIAADGAITRTALPAWDPQWQWVEKTAPPFAIDNQPLAAFLEWVARETGRQLIYASPEAERIAARVRMQGSIANLDIATALTAVLATTQLRAESEPQSLKIVVK
jgi:hypothetical protein